MTESEEVTQIAADMQQSRTCLLRVIRGFRTTSRYQIDDELMSKLFDAETDLENTLVDYGAAHHRWIEGGL